MPAFQAALFDIDGTLVDTVDLHAEAWAETLRRFGQDLTPADIRVHIGKGSDQLLPGLLPPDLLGSRGEEISAVHKDLYMAEYLPRARPFPQVRALFESLRTRGISIALATSGTPPEVEHHKGLLGIEGLLDAETTSEEAERSKPFPDIFEAAARKLGVAPDQALVIGDTPYDAEAARTGGIASLGVLSGGFPESTLRAAGCVAVYRDPGHLLEALDRSPFVQGLP
jgi:HAD superfamily hydrolase (TIGR01509 family)